MTTPPPSPAGGLPPYWCFISYRHADNKDPGRQWATWLHQQIETYEVPEDLVGTTNERGEVIPERIFPVFRDEEELPADADLGSPIYRALDRSRFLLVLCSPQAVQSTYVANEIAYFKKIGRGDRVLAALLEGEPNASWDEGKQRAGLDPSRECFPLPLQFAVDPSGRIDRSQRAEPIAADFRLPDGSPGWTSPEAFRQAIGAEVPKARVDELVGAYQQQCELARLKIIAGILGLPLGTLTKRDKAYQLEKERRRAVIFRRVAGALGLLALAAIAAGLFALVKREEAVANQKKAEEATVTAVRNQERAVLAEGEARSNLERAEGLLWEASSNAWSEASRSHAAGRNQDALAYLAAGMRNAPANTGLVTFAACLLGERNYPLRTLTFDLPVIGVAYTRDPRELVVAELYYSAATRYSLWNPDTGGKQDEVLIAAGTDITDRQKADRPWLEFAPPPRASNNAEGDGLETAWSPCSMRGVSANYERVVVRGEGIGWGHPWYDLDEAEPQLRLPDSAWATGYSWRPDGNVLATSHGVVDAVSQQESGRVHLWDLRTATGFRLLPEAVVPFSAIDPAAYEFRAEGGYLLGSRDEGIAVYRKDDRETLWTVDPLAEGGTIVVDVDAAAAEALVVHIPAFDPEAEKDAPVRVTLERRAMDSGAVLGTSSFEARGFSGSDALQVLRHPGGEGYALMATAFLVSWDGTDRPPVAAPDLGPADEVGWAGSLAFLPDGNSLLAGLNRKLLQVSWPDLEILAGPRYHETIVSSLAVNADATLAVSGAGFGDGAGSAGYAQVWSLPGLEPLGPRLNHDNQIERVAFLASGGTFVSSTQSPEGSDLRIWDSRTSLPLTGYLVPPAGTGQAFLSFHSYRDGPVSVIRADGDVDAFGTGAFTTRLPTPQAPVPAWFHEHFLPFAACTTLTAGGTLAPVPAADLHAHHQAVAGALASVPAEQDTAYTRLARWYLTDPSARTLSPFAAQTRDAYLEEHLFAPIRGGKQGIGAANGYALDPSHPLLHLHRALNEEDLEKQLHYLKYGYYRLSRPANEQTYGRERWHEQIRTAQKLLTILKQPAAVEELEAILKAK